MIMKTIALFGGSGRTGQHFLKQALAEGYAVRALARNPEKITTDNEQLTVIPGDVLSYSDVLKTVEGTDVVVSLFGHVKGSPEGLQTNGTKNIVRAMKEQSVARIISLSGGGLPYEQDEPKFADKAIRFIMKVAAKKILNDAIEHAEVLRQSDRTWTIVRGPRLTDEAKHGSYRVGWVGVNASTKIGRADLADFILQLVEDTQYDGQMPFVSY